MRFVPFGRITSRCTLCRCHHGASNWNEEESRKNFELVQRVAIPGDLKSPLLVHPLLPNPLAAISFTVEASTSIRRTTRNG